MTPGLFIITCACPDKRIYGILKMVWGESPRIIFDIIMGRFEEDYSPNIFYDASCRLKEFGMNREPNRFQALLMAIDPVNCQPYVSEQINLGNMKS